MKTSPALPQANPDQPPWLQREVHELVNEYAVDPEQGLPPSEVEQRLELHGPNELPDVMQRGPLPIAGLRAQAHRRRLSEGLCCKSHF